MSGLYLVLGCLAAGAAACVVDRVTSRARTPIRRAAADALVVGELLAAGGCGALAWLWLG